MIYDLSSVELKGRITLLGVVFTFEPFPYEIHIQNVSMLKKLVSIIFLSKPFIRSKMSMGHP